MASNLQYLEEPPVKNEEHREAETIEKTIQEFYNEIDTSHNR